MGWLVTDALGRAERAFGTAEGAVCGGVRLTYAEFGARSRRLAAGLRAHGVGRGDRVAVLMDNCHRYLEAYAAVPGIGAMIVPLNTRHPPAEHRAVLRDCQRGSSSRTRPTATWPGNSRSRAPWWNRSGTSAWSTRTARPS